MIGDIVANFLGFGLFIGFCALPAWLISRDARKKEQAKKNRK